LLANGNPPGLDTALVRMQFCLEPRLVSEEFAATNAADMDPECGALCTHMGKFRFS